MTVEPLDLTALSKADLVDEANSRTIDFKPKATKAELIAAIEAFDEAESIAAKPPTPTVEAVVEDTTEAVSEEAVEATPDPEPDDGGLNVSVRTAEQEFTRTMNSFRSDKLGGAIDYVAYNLMVTYRPELPLRVRDQSYAELELAIRQYTTDDEERRGNSFFKTRTRYDLPVGHDLGGRQLQDLLVHLIESKEKGVELPPWTIVE